MTQGFQRNIFHIKIPLPEPTVACQSSTIYTPSISHISNMKGDIEKSVDTINPAFWCKFWEKYQITIFLYFDPSYAGFFECLDDFPGMSFLLEFMGQIGLHFQNLYENSFKMRHRRAKTDHKWRSYGRWNVCVKGLTYNISTTCDPISARDSSLFC